MLRPDDFHMAMRADLVCILRDVVGLIARIEAISSYSDLHRMIGLMHAQLGIQLRITPSPNEVKTLRGIIIQLDAQPGLCRKTRANIPAAIRRCLDARPEIAFAILDSHDLLGGI